MKINNTSLPTIGASAPVQETPRVEGPAAASPHAPTTSSSPLQSATLEPAMTALQGMPEIDQAKVEAVRDALAKGEINFDAKKLAGLIARYHGGR
ncbi:MAG: flagellar biosynthesis anti-sigma factor FlgM [Aquabacterium sp.]|uniref:flagellar biosynthesis anti-sigma factor FlgM n=1 Tax=Aquabacterium sp. TaxID=1872578 RepID=UPI0025C6E8BD|nr:flagellar biosynthesis anti-sigma factor FlgM [Aquabacterium sp.]MBI3381719.1 flagellar biosynthesis anti-sigma factor FlgM [Aquabacterium sp.]